jgi:hypothetical protein
MTKPQQAADYDASRTELAEQVLLEVWGRLGEFHDYLVLVGGLVPRYLVTQPCGQAVTPPLHCGTMDVDLGVSLAVADAKTYETIRVALTDRLGFEPGRNPAGREQCHSFTRTISGIPVSLDFLTTQYGGPRTLVRAVERSLSAIQVEGLGLALTTPLRVTIRGISLSGAKTVETVSVCRPVPFVVLKALAFEKRRERKDVYDLVYVLRYYQDGPSSLAAEATAEERSAESFAHAVESLRTRFETPEHDGPVAYADFMGREAGAAVQAFAAVQEFLATL